MKRTIAGMVVAALAMTSGALAGLTEVTNIGPAVDRWMYPFGSTPGTETTAYCFTSLGNAGGDMFDDHDGQFLIGWDTGAAGILSGQATDHYRIMSAQVTLRVSADQAFRFDPTYDSYKCLLATSDPDYVADSDPYLVGPPSATNFPAHPMELFVCGYRNGWTQGTFLAEPIPGTPVTPASPFKPASTGGTFRGTRNVFAAAMDVNGVVTDQSNNVGGRFESSPIAIGQATGVAPGALVPLNTDVTFTIDLSNPGTVRYLREGLASGRLNLMVASLAQAPQQVLTVPTFYTKEGAAQSADPAAQGPRLTLDVCVGQPADWDCSGAVTIDDIFAYLNSWFSGKGDFDGNGQNTIDDIFVFLNAWFATH